MNLLFDHAAGGNARLPARITLLFAAAALGLLLLVGIGMQQRPVSHAFAAPTLSPPGADAATFFDSVRLAVVNGA